jgi:hypothetical protein
MTEGALASKLVLLAALTPRCHQIEATYPLRQAAECCNMLSATAIEDHDHCLTLSEAAASIIGLPAR